MENTEDLAVAALLDQMGEGQPTEPVAQPAPVAVEPQSQQPVNVQQNPVPTEPVEPTQPQIAPEMMALLNGYQELQNSLNGMKEQITQNTQPPVEPTEQEAAMQQLKDQLGFGELESQNKNLVDQLNQMQQYIQQQQIQNEVAQFKAERPDANEQAIVEYISKMPQEMQAAMDNPNGWRMVDDLLSARSQPQQQPDPIVPSQNTQNTQPTNTFDKLKKGEKASDLDIGSALLSAAGYN